jgi:hypothetical protein
MFRADFLLCLVFGPEEEGGMFYRNEGLVHGVMFEKI